MKRIPKLVSKLKKAADDAGFVWSEMTDPERLHLLYTMLAKFEGEDQDFNAMLHLKFVEAMGDSALRLMDVRNKILPQFDTWTTKA